MIWIVDDENLVDGALKFIYKHSYIINIYNIIIKLFFLFSKFKNNYVIQIKNEL